MACEPVYQLHRRTLRGGSYDRHERRAGVHRTTTGGGRWPDAPECEGTLVTAGKGGGGC